MEAELTELIDRNKKQIEAMEAVNTPPTEDIYCSASEIKERIKVPIVSSVAERRDALQEISLNKVSSYHLYVTHFLHNFLNAVSCLEVNLST